MKSPILESLPAQVAVLDRAGVIIAVNDAWSEFARTLGAGFTADRGLGANYLRACAAAGHDELTGNEAVAAIEEACRGERSSRRVEYRCDWRGAERWFLMTAAPLRGAKGGAVITHWDITSRKLRGTALNESEDRFRHMADALPIAIWMSDAEAGGSYFNKQWLQLTGRTMQEERGEGWLEGVHVADRAACVEAYLHAFHVREGFRMEYRLRRHDGKYRWVLDTGVPRYGSDGAFDGYVGGCLDITERKEAERMLRELSHRLIAAQDDERRRIARELHDHLSQQLALLAIDLQQLALVPPSSRDAFVSALQDAWGRTTEIASDVHAISHRLHPSKMEALGLVTTIRAHCRDVSRQRLTVHFEDHDVPPGILADRALTLFRVLEEALSNIARHSGAREAHVSLAAVDGMLILRIADSGGGFSIDHAWKGMGLVSMRERVQSLDGTLSIASAPGRGTLIEARVPIAPLRGVRPGIGSALTIVRAESA